MTTPKSAKPVITAIGKGSYDSDLAEIADAIKARVLATGALARWKITFDDVEVSEESITLDEAAGLEVLLGKPWVRISPTSSARDCRALLHLILTGRKGLTPEKAEERLKGLTFEQALDTISVY